MGGTCPGTQEAYSSGYGHMAQEAAPASEDFLQSSALWPVETVALPGWDFPSYVPTHRVPLFFCGLNFRLGIIVVMFRTVEPLRGP